MMIIALLTTVIKAITINASDERIVEKEELMDRPWPDTFVEEANLTFNIKQLRKSLGDDARRPLYVQTVARRGYRFIAPIVTDEHAVPRFAR